MNKKTYALLQIKRASKIYPAVFVITVITLLSIALTASVLLFNNSKSADKTKLRVGIVGDTSESYLQLGIEALKNFDSSRYVFDFCEMNEDEARKALKKHELSAYVRIPDNFVKGIFDGDNIPVDFVTLDDTTGFESAVLNEILDCVSDWVMRAQGSIYSLDNLTNDHGTKQGKKDIYTNIDNMNLMYIERVITRSNIFNVRVLGVADSVSMEGYYIGGILIFFLLIWGISFNKLFINKNPDISGVLRSRGMSVGFQILCEYCGYIIFTMLTLFIFALIFGIIIQFNDFGVKELVGVDVFMCIGFVIKIIPVIIMITFMHVMLYDLVSGTANAIMLQLFAAVGLAYVSGCFYPNYFFPETVQHLASYLPSGVGFAYIRKAMTETLLLKELFGSVVYTLIFAGVSAFARKRRMEGVLR